MMVATDMKKSRNWIILIQLMFLLWSMVAGLHEKSDPKFDVENELTMRKTEFADDRSSSSLTIEDIDERGEKQIRALVSTDSEIPSYAPSGSPTPQPKIPPTPIPTTMQPVEQTPKPTKIKKTPKPSTRPTVKTAAPAPKPTPTEKPKAKPTPTPTPKPTASPSKAPTHAPTPKNKDDDIKYPKIRFTVWDDLTSDQRDTARTIGYHTDLWNEPGTFSIEKWSYGTLISEDSDAEEALHKLEINKATWNCYGMVLFLQCVCIFCP
jgi:hypothetical protein